MKARSAVLFLVFAGLAWPSYNYYYTDNLTYNTGYWTQNGTVQFSSLDPGLTGSGSLISTVAVPDGTSQYEIKTTVKLNSSVYGTYYHYLHATPDARSGPSPQGTFYSLS